MASISRKDTPRLFMLSKNALKSAKGDPGPHSPCTAVMLHRLGTRSCLQRECWAPLPLHSSSMLRNSSFPADQDNSFSICPTVESECKDTLSPSRAAIGIDVVTIQHSSSNLLKVGILSS